MSKEASISKSEKRQALLEQKKNAARVDFQLYLQREFARIAKRYLKQCDPDWKNLTIRQRKLRRNSMTDGLIGAYMLQQHPEPQGNTTGFGQISLSEENARYLGILAPYMKNILAKEKRFQEKAKTYNVIKRFNVTRRALRRLRKDSMERKDGISDAMGYKPQENVGRKVGKSVYLTGILTGIAWTTEAVAMGLEKVLNISGGLGLTMEPISLAILIGSYALHYATALLSAKLNYKLLHDSMVNNSPNMWATSFHFLLKPLLPLLEKPGVVIGSIGPSIVEDLPLLSLLFVPGGPALLTAKNLAGSAVFAATNRFFKTESGRRRLQVNGPKRRKLEKNS